MMLQHAEGIERRPSKGDAIHARLRKAVEKRERAYLWVPLDAITFKPALLPLVYGDGRALFRLATINQRPRYWIIRGDSNWKSESDGGLIDLQGPDFGELTDDIMADLEMAFGAGRCGYSGSSLFYPKRERMLYCKCEDCRDGPMARWPMVDSEGGCSWSRMDWPPSFETVPNPVSWRGNLLAVPG